MSGTKHLSFKLVPGENATELLDAQAHIWNHRSEERRVGKEC